MDQTILVAVATAIAGLRRVRSYIIVAHLLSHYEPDAWYAHHVPPYGLR